jgi:sugar O-acyltransferase (sialic acid O-acetyltransferase NeuD family)
MYIIGCGGFAKEVYSILYSLNYKIEGFINKDSSITELIVKNNIIPVIDETYFLENFKNVDLCIGIGDPVLIKNISNIFKDYNFPNIIHPTVLYDDNLEIGFGNIITQGCILTIDIKIGNFNIININSTIGHDVIIGDFNVINPSVNISGKCVIGDMNLIGVSSVIIENKKIGNNSILGANSTLITDMYDNSVYVGSPAKIKKLKN